MFIQRAVLLWESTGDSSTKRQLYEKPFKNREAGFIGIVNFH